MTPMHNLFPQARDLPSEWRFIAQGISLTIGVRPILCGGALRDHLHGKPVKDLDFFVPHTEARAGSLLDAFLMEGWDKIQDISTSCEGLNEVRAVLGFTNPMGDTPDVNVIFLDPEVEFSLEAVAGRCDFGICQIAAHLLPDNQNWRFDYTPAFAKDVSARTFTLTRTGDEDRSMRRYERLREKYPEHRLIAP